MGGIKLAGNVPLFRCSKCQKLNYERKLKTGFARFFAGGFYVCTFCDKSVSGWETDKLRLKSGTELNGLLINEVLTVFDLQSSQAIIIPTTQLRYMKNFIKDKELWGFYTNGGQKIIGILTDTIKFVLPETSQELTFQPKDIQSLQFENIYTSILDRLFDDVSEIIEAISKDIDETPKEELQKRVQERAEKIQIIKDAASGISPSAGDVEKRKQVLEVEQTKTQILQEKIQQLKLQAKPEPTSVTRPVAEKIDIEKKIEQAKQTFIAVQKAREEIKEIYKNEPDLLEQMLDRFDRMLIEEGILKE